MSIEKTYSEFVAVCDLCGETLPPEPYFSDAVDAKKKAGWKSHLQGSEWEDICPDCQKL